MSDTAGTPSATTPLGRGRVRRCPADEVRQRRRRTFTTALLVVLGVLLVNALVGEHGYLATIRASQDEATLDAELARVRLDSLRLQRERERLDEDPAAIEEAARAMGMIRPGEVIINVRDADPAAPPASTR